MKWQYFFKQSRFIFVHCAEGSYLVQNKINFSNYLQECLLLCCVANQKCVYNLHLRFTGRTNLHFVWSLQTAGKIEIISSMLENKVEKFYQIYNKRLSSFEVVNGSYIFLINVRKLLKYKHQYTQIENLSAFTKT